MAEFRGGAFRGCATAVGRVAAVLGGAGSAAAVRAAGGAGFGLAEALTLAVLLCCRLLLASDRAERLGRRLVRPLVRTEGNLATGRLGYDLVIEAVRRAGSGSRDAQIGSGNSRGGTQGTRIA